MERNITMRLGQGLVLAALTFLVAGCEQNLQSSEAGRTPVADGAETTKDANEARTLTPLPVEDEALKSLLARGMKASVGSTSPQGSALAKSAAQACLIDFNNATSLSAMADHAFALYAIYPWYQQTCGAHTAMVTPTQGPQYYLLPTEPNACIGNYQKMGYGMIGPNCMNQKDAALFPRMAGITTSTDARIGLAINDVSAGSYRNFTLKSLTVVQGPVYVYGFKNPGGWLYWGPLATGSYAIMSGDNLGQAQILSSNGSGVFMVDNINIVAN